MQWVRDDSFCLDTWHAVVLYTDICCMYVLVELLVKLTYAYPVVSVVIFRYHGKLC
jgi:hypothetical protein